MAKFKFEDLLYIKGRIGWQALSKNEYLKKGNYYLVTGIDIQNNNLINWDKCYFVSKERYEQDEKIQLKIGDIILTKDGTIGKIGYIDKLEKPATLNSHLFLIRNKREDILNTRYLFWLLQSNLFLKYTEGNSTGSNILGFTQKSICNFEIELPDIKTQNNIANILDNVNTQILRNNTMIQKLPTFNFPTYCFSYKKGEIKYAC